VEFRFHRASCVVVGTFNTYVIQPPLLTEMGVLRDGQTAELLFDFTQPGMRFRIDDVTWTIRPERLAIESTNSRKDCGCDASLVLQKLCWTPIRAVGTNIVFATDVASEHELPQTFRLPALADGFPTQQRSAHLAVCENELLVNIQLAASEGKLELSLNVHTDLRHSIRRSQLAASKRAQEACAAFFGHREFAIQRAASLLGATFSYEHADSA
jgi:hypothetical protein